MKTSLRMHDRFLTFLPRNTNIPLDKNTSPTIVESTFVRVNLQFINHETSDFQIACNQDTNLSESTRVIPRFETDNIVPSGRFVALTCVRMTSRGLFLLVSLLGESETLSSV